MRQKNLIALLLVMAVIPAAAVADNDDDDDDEELPFDEAHIFFELNHTDGDLGIHALIDGEAWKRLSVEDHREKTILNVFVRGRLRQQGLTEIFFESAEPAFDELTPAEFFQRFPAGTYEIEAKTLEGDELESEVELTHRMPAPAEPTVNGMPMAQQCDEEEPGYDATLVGPPGTPVTIAWPAVDSTHPDLGSPQGSADITIHNYEVVVEIEGEDELTTVFSALIPPDIMSMTIPAEFLALGDTFKYEVLAREESFNQTAVESCFVFENGD